MNIDVCGRIRPSIRGEGNHNLEIDGNNRVANRPGGTFFTFQNLFRQESLNYDVYKRTVESLMDLYLVGFNTCLFVTGETGSGKSFTIAGESSTKAGLVPLIIEHIFARIEGDDHYMYDKSLNTTSHVSMHMFEIYNELVKDLMQVPGIHTEYCDVDESSEQGVYVRNASSVGLPNASEGTSLFRQAWARRNMTTTDFGPAKNHSTIVIQIDLTLKSKDAHMPNKSRFTIVVTAGLEKLAEDSSQIRMREGPTLSKSVISVSQLAAGLANQPFPDRNINYTDSKLTHILREELGGNCKTRVLVCLRPQSDPAVLGSALRFASHLSQVKNFPVLNDFLAKDLLTQYRARILHLQQQLGLGAGLPNPTHVHDVQDELQRIQTENLQLRDKNERLHQKLDQLQGKFGVLASSKTDLSAQLLMTEEEKLKVSKTLVEMQIDNNKLKEEAEASRFDLTNKILQLENDLTEMEIDRDKHQKAARNSRERLQDLGKDRKDLADEYVNLKTNFVAITKASDREHAKNEELSMELLNLVNAKAALMRQMEHMQLVHGSTGDPNVEIDRVRAIVSRMSRRPDEEYKATKSDRDNVEKSLFGDQRRFQGEMDRMKSQYDNDQHKLEHKMTSLRKEAQDSRNLARERQKKISEMNAQMITMRSAHDELQSLNNRLQHKLKDINDDFKTRLIKYVEDVATFVDQGSQPKGGGRDEMRGYVKDMIQDLRKAHKVREDQLSTAAQSYRTRMERTTRKHEELLVAYRQLRQMIEDRGYDDLDLGPDEKKFQLDDKELVSSQQKEINRLRNSLAEAENNVDGAKLRDRMGDYNDKDKRGGKAQSERQNWGQLQKQLHEFTTGTQHELERERADLLGRNAMLAEQLRELQDYIDSHLARYKDEIMRLRGMLGITDAAGFNSPGPNYVRNGYGQR